MQVIFIHVAIRRVAVALAALSAMLFSAGVPAPDPAWGEAAADARSPALAGSSPSITAADLMAHIRALASEEMAGRRTGEPGGARAEEYVARVFQSFGLKPAGRNGSFFQRFEFVTGVRLGPRSRLEARGASGQDAPSARTLRLNVDWRPLGYSGLGQAPARCVVFAGYGLRLGRPGAKDRYDSYAATPDVKGCWVLVWRGAPPEVERERLAALLRVSGISYKASVARSVGASGLIVADGPGLGYARGLPPLRFGARSQREAMPVVALTADAAKALLRQGGLDPKALAKKLERGAPKGAPMRLAGVEIAGEIDLQVLRGSGRNVIGRLAVSDAASASPLLIGAHLDHLGRGGGFASLARAGERGLIHFGADDNASGVSALLEIAQNLASDRDKLADGAKRDVVFAAWMGEELGLLGSAAYADWRRRVSAGAPASGYINLDMVGRLRETLQISGLSSSPDWEPAVLSAGKGLGISVELEPNAYLPTDATSLFLAGSPVLSLSTGQHDDYHSPRDSPDLINSDGLRKIATMIERLTRERLAAPKALAFRAPLAGRGQSSRRSGSVYLGVLPEFAPGDRRGAPLLGVVEDGPAASAGLQTGDVLIELAGRPLITLYDLVQVLDELEPGRPVEVAALRGERTVRLVVTPRLRE